MDELEWLLCPAFNVGGHFEQHILYCVMLLFDVLLNGFDVLPSGSYNVGRCEVSAYFHLSALPRTPANWAVP